MAAERHVDGWLQLYRSIPVVTRTYITACILITVATYWRIVTTFLYCGQVSFGMIFNLLFTYRYSRILEETSFHRRTADYCFMLLFMASLMLFVSLTFTTLIFLGHPFTHALLYVWCRRNPNHRVIILGLMTLNANSVPLVLVGLSLLLGSPLTADLVAIGAGHVYYFLEDVFPYQYGGFRILRTPKILKILLDGHPEQAYPMPAEDDEDDVDVRDGNRNNEGRRDGNNNVADEGVAPGAFLNDDVPVENPFHIQ